MNQENNPTDPLEKMMSQASSKSGPQKQVVVVHGLNPYMTDEVVSTLRELEITPIVSQDKSNANRPMTEKVKMYKNVSFAIIILYPDMLARPPEVDPKDALLYANQKVVFEFGFWTAKLGREGVFVLYHEKKRFRRPTEYYDAIYTPFDDNNLWKKELVNRLKSCGF